MLGAAVAVVAIGLEGRRGAADIDPVDDDRSVAVSNGYAYLAAGYDGLVVIDLSEPIDPVVIDVFDPVESIDGTPSIEEPVCVARLTADRNRQSLKWIDAMVFGD